MKSLSLIALLTGCAVDKDQVGPTVHVQFDAAFGGANDMTTNPEFDLFSDAEYTVDVEIDTDAGTESQTGKYSTYPVAKFTLTTSVPGVDIPDSDYTKQDILDDPRWTRDHPIVIPGSAKGSAMAVHLEAEDSRGLASNVVDFSIALN